MQQPPPIAHVMTSPTHPSTGSASPPSAPSSHVSNGSGQLEGMSSSLGTILSRGWLNLKIRSMVNVRPRHVRYCVLVQETQMLATFKFQPSTGDLTSGLVKPLRAYRVLGVVPWSGRRFGFLVTAMQYGENVDRLLEVDAPTDIACTTWIQAIRLVLDDPQWNRPVASSQTLVAKDEQDENRPKQSHMWVKGASVHRGLLNDAGENNCFLNVVIQSFWHLTAMRHFLLHVEIKDELRTVEANVLRALKSIMKEYDDTTSGTIHSRALRKGLSVLFAADKNFQEGAMYDAEETLLALLNLMHQQTDATEVAEIKKTTRMVRTLVRVVSNEQYEETPQAVFDENSIPHLVFSHQIYDRYVCSECHHSTQWDLYSNLVFTTYASDLCGQKFASTEEMFRTISAHSEDVSNSCEEENCNGRNIKERVIRRFPMVFAISILWATDHATREQLQGLLVNFADRVDLAHAFEADGPASRYKNGGLRTTYRIRGLVCYYGRHYVALFYSTAHKSWLLFDDNRVLELGTWEKAMEECLKGRFQPVLIFYELPDQRKDSSVSILSLSDLQAGGRRKSSSMSSVQGEMQPPTIQETIDEGDESSPTRFKHGASAAPPFQSVEEEVLPVNNIVDIEVNEATENSELGRQASGSQNISPVSPAIAMCPRTLAMNSTLGDGEYDVRFGADARILGMYLERVGEDLCVTSFPRDVNGDMFGAEKCGRIGLFDTVVQANGHPLHHYAVDRALKIIKAQSRPLIIRFRRSKRVKQLMDMGVDKDVAIQALISCQGDVRAAAEKCFERQQ